MFRASSKMLPRIFCDTPKSMQWSMSTDTQESLNPGHVNNGLTDNPFAACAAKKASAVSLDLLQAAVMLKSLYEVTSALHFQQIPCLPAQDGKLKVSLKNAQSPRTCNKIAEKGRLPTALARTLSVLHQGLPSWRHDGGLPETRIVIHHLKMARMPSNVHRPLQPHLQRYGFCKEVKKTRSDVGESKVFQENMLTDDFF